MPKVRVAPKTKFKHVALSMPIRLERWFKKFANTHAAYRNDVIIEVLAAFSEKRKPVFKTKKSKMVAELLKNKRAVAQVIKELGIDRRLVKDLDNEFITDELNYDVAPEDDVQEIDLTPPEGKPPENPFE